MKTKAIGYWVVTALSVLAIWYSSWLDLSRAPAVLEGMSHLGYPDYLPAILGVWKLLAGAALLAPRLPRLKEWAYAGVFFDLTGASLSHALSGDPTANVITPLVILGIVAASWALRPAARKTFALEPALSLPTTR